MSAEPSLVVGDVDISQLSDEDLYTQLTSLGAVVGPIVGTTRNTYQRKLAVLMGANVANYSIAELTISQDDSDLDVDPSQAYIERLAGGENVTRRRTKLTVEYSDPAVDTDEDEVLDGDVSTSRLYSPSPRPPLRTPNTSYSRASYVSSPMPSFVPSAASSPGSPSLTSPPLRSRQPQQAEGGGMVQLIVKCALVAVLLWAAYYFFVAKSSQDAFVSLEHLAKTATDALEQEKRRDAPRQGL